MKLQFSSEAEADETNDSNVVVITIHPDFGDHESYDIENIGSLTIDDIIYQEYGTADLSNLETESVASLQPLIFSESDYEIQGQECYDDFVTSDMPYQEQCGSRNLMHHEAEVEKRSEYVSSYQPFNLSLSDSEDENEENQKSSTELEDDLTNLSPFPYITDNRICSRRTE